MCCGRGIWLKKKNRRIKKCLLRGEWGLIRWHLQKKKVNGNSVEGGKLSNFLEGGSGVTEKKGRKEKRLSRRVGRDMRWKKKS